MIKIENVDISGWETALRGCRNSFASWNKSDSMFMCLPRNMDHFDKILWHDINGEIVERHLSEEGYFSKVDIGPNDLKLMRTLANTGRGSERKYLRYITVTADIIAPLYWWKEFDQSKIGTVTNSTSTMHSITNKKFRTEDFSWEDCRTEYAYRTQLDTLNSLNQLREVYLHGGKLGIRDVEVNNWWTFKNQTFEPKDKRIWREIIQLLPSSYNQKRTVLLNYEVLANQYQDRRNHRLTEWLSYCDWIGSLPYSELITGPRKE